MLEAYAVVAASNKPTTVYAEYLFVCVRDGAIYPSTCLSVHLDRDRDRDRDRQADTIARCFYADFWANYWL